LAGTQYDEADDVEQMRSTGVYPDFDAFNRVIRSRWTKGLATDVDFYHVEVWYDRNSNIIAADDQVHSGVDVVYTLDNVDRLSRAEEGTVSSGSISNRTRDQQWTLSHRRLGLR
jgi:hypothetical protein